MKIVICVTPFFPSGKCLIDQIRRFEIKNVTASVVERENQAIIPLNAINHCFSNRRMKRAASFRAIRFSYCESSDSCRNQESTYNATSDRRHNSLSD
jgi:hypothetical protein